MKLPSLKQSYVAAIVLAAGVASAGTWLLALPERSSGPAPGLVILFAILLILLEFRPFPSIMQSSFLTFAWTFAYTLVFLAPIPVAVSIVALTVFTAQVAGHAPLEKALFNSSHMVLSLSAGWLAGSQVDDVLKVSGGGEADARWLGAVVVTCAVGLALSSAVVGVAIALHSDRSVSACISEAFRDNVACDGPLLTMTPIFVVISTLAPALLTVLLFSAGMIVWSSTKALRNEEDATHDALTELPNRRTLNTTAQESLSLAAEREQPLAIIQIDLDGFKEINDSHGHRFGDFTLVEVARRLRDRKREVDHLARLGGDEFALILPATDASQARLLAEACLAAIRRPLEVEGQTLHLSASFGIATFPEDGEDLDSLLHHADLAMYLAKRNGTGIESFSDGIRDVEEKHATNVSAWP